MRINIDLDDNVVKHIQQAADRGKRTRKNHIELLCVIEAAKEIKRKQLIKKR